MSQSSRQRDKPPATQTGTSSATAGGVLRLSVDLPPRPNSSPRPPRPPQFNQHLRGLRTAIAENVRKVRWASRSRFAPLDQAAALRSPTFHRFVPSCLRARSLRGSSARGSRILNSSYPVSATHIRAHSRHSWFETSRLRAFACPVKIPIHPKVASQLNFCAGCGTSPPICRQSVTCPACTSSPSLITSSSLASAKEPLICSSVFISRQFGAKRRRLSAHVICFCLGSVSPRFRSSFWLRLCRAGLSVVKRTVRFDHHATASGS
jgi:hypothetical protein